MNIEEFVVQRFNQSADEDEEESRATSNEVSIWVVGYDARCSIWKSMEKAESIRILTYICIHMVNT